MAAEGLPVGLINNNTEAVSEEIEKIERVAVDQLACLWRAYSTNKNLLANDVGRRLENFFWRIWGSEHIRKTISGSQVAALFETISEGSIIRTTPTPSPRSSHVWPAIRTATHGPRPSPTPPTPPPSTEGQELPSAEPVEGGLDGPEAGNGRRGTRRGSKPPSVEEEKGRRRSPSRPPPILKKPGLEYSSSAKTARIQTPGWKSTRIDPDHDEPLPSAEAGGRSRRSSPPPPTPSPLSRHGSFDPFEEAASFATKPPNGEATSPAPRPRGPARGASPSRSPPSSGTAASNQGKVPKKKSTFVASKASSKRRPVLSRRKSSQNSSGTTSKAASFTASRTAAPPFTPSITPPAGPAQTDGAPRPAATDTATGVGKRTDRPAPTSRPTSRSASPVSASPFRRPSRDHAPVELSPGGSRPLAGRKAQSASTQQDWLVDRDFRGKFVDRGRGLDILPFVSLAAKAGPISSAASSFQATGSMAELARASAPTPTGLKTALGKLRIRTGFGPGARGDGSAGNDDDASPTSRVLARREDGGAGTRLPRTKSQSQLSNLLDEETRRGKEREKKKGG